MPNRSFNTLGRAHARGFTCAALLVAASAAAPQQLPPDSEPGIAERVLTASPYAIEADPALAAFVKERADAAIAAHCAGCHGADLTGSPGVPNLVDYDWLWGITFEETNDVGPVREIEQTILYGIRHEDCPNIEHLALYGGCPDTRFSEMPGYAALNVFDDDQIADLTEYVLQLSGAAADTEAAERGRALWPVCIECHGDNGEGYKPYGGPDLTDAVSLYGNDRETVRDVIAEGRAGVCPAWKDRLDAATIKALAVEIWWRATGG